MMLKSPSHDNFNRPFKNHFACCAARAVPPIVCAVTILEVIQRSTDFLTKKGVSSPRLQVELFVAHVLKMQRMQIYLNFERVLTEAEVSTLRDMVQRRGTREPLQYIIGNVQFCGWELNVTPAVLIPRPETEMLAERGWQFLSTINHTPSTALDFGTGSGCLAIALASKVPNAEVHALDASPEALKIAQENAAKQNVKVQFHQGNGFEALHATPSRFDLIISNPPYIPSAEIETLDPEVRDHEPRSALDGGADGLDFYRLLASESKNWLKPEGKILLEFGDGQADAVKKTFEEQKFVVESVECDYSQRPRILSARPPLS
ncbi:MAG: peptide chain release factor N(5)-glutamine methyltransferase [Limisphaerales bacterium]